MSWSPLILTLQLATVTTAVLFVVGLPLAWWLARSTSRFKSVAETLISMPLVLPPTVLGFYFLIAFSPGNAFGSWLEETLGLRLVFSFGGLVLASVIYSLPFMVHPLQSGLTALPDSLIDAARLMGKSRWEILRRVQLPNIRPAMLTGLVLSFAHTVGEFGVVLMIGGNIPGQTRVASIAIYDEVEAMNYEAANAYSLILFAVSFLVLLGVYWVNGRNGNPLPTGKRLLKR
ncbi:molybdate ABC transporter permease subunit [Neolewinella agarilytica]|uniref:Molybdenum transport system permease n=1 Tax=Neolewinella agarilytica TaxID=478744 RepID=A0A1H9IA45_9BACT|nr:molybdate ABC transporter permease subunit [Neolewinella agarilytica]SEQ71388.1 molybdate transport system permease protein [Neolewinella agarilytica]